MSKRYELCVQVLDAFKAWDIEAIMSYRAEDCIHEIAPSKSRITPNLSKSVKIHLMYLHISFPLLPTCRIARTSAPRQRRLPGLLQRPNTPLPEFQPHRPRNPRRRSPEQGRHLVQQHRRLRRGPLRERVRLVPVVQRGRRQGSQDRRVCRFGFFEKILWEDGQVCR